MNSEKNLDNLLVGDSVWVFGQTKTDKVNEENAITECKVKSIVSTDGFIVISFEYEGIILECTGVHGGSVLVNHRGYCAYLSLTQAVESRKAFLQEMLEELEEEILKKIQKYRLLENRIKLYTV